MLLKTLPNFANQQWLAAQLPVETENWLDGKKYAVRKCKSNYTKAKESVLALLKTTEWKWPKRPVIFITDLHADANALTHSLLASGGIEITNKGKNFKLTEFGKKALFIFGGDFFDKGPSNLELLRALHQLIKTGARVRLIAGNHDIRVLFGMRSVGQTDDPRNAHFFIRMGAKAVPFLQEIKEQYLTKTDLKNTPEQAQCERMLYPQENWWQQFPQLATWVMPQVAIDREMQKINKKVERFSHVCSQHQLTVREAYAAAIKWQQLFLQPDGEFYWFFKRLKLAHKTGSLLYVHAGLDDRTATMLNEFGVSHINNSFKEQLNGSPFEFYYGPLANTIRTKYRVVDMPLTEVGTEQAHQAGIYAIMHGHRNLHHGQRIAIRKQLLHFECDVTLDINSRQKERLSGSGAGATLITPQAEIIGISTDYKHIKVFQPEKIKQHG
ncbi:metallophosphoesterase [Catenovulum sediminis]|uniref:Metallophosphoesterase n=1 Tax=Catenovulum sediminis TaxID=1740262 RepID=A0ABV1RDK5_9ALTE|nr:metallophosphoesterase [Catenovulum sediminis]